jgi:hypothetical protein
LRRHRVSDCRFPAQFWRLPLFEGFDPGTFWGATLVIEPLVAVRLRRQSSPKSLGRLIKGDVSHACQWNFLWEGLVLIACQLPAVPGLD